jgi:hypothetical protein
MPSRMNDERVPYLVYGTSSPRRLIQAEGDDSWLSYHSLSSFPRLKPMRPSAVLFMGGRKQ